MTVPQRKLTINGQTTEPTTYTVDVGCCNCNKPSTVTREIGVKSYTGVCPICGCESLTSIVDHWRRMADARTLRRNALQPLTPAERTVNPIPMTVVPPTATVGAASGVEPVRRSLLSIPPTTQQAVEMDFRGVEVSVASYISQMVPEQRAEFRSQYMQEPRQRPTEEERLRQAERQQSTDGRLFSPSIRQNAAAQNAIDHLREHQRRRSTEIQRAAREANEQDAAIAAAHAMTFKIPPLNPRDLEDQLTGSWNDMRNATPIVSTPRLTPDSIAAAMEAAIAQCDPQANTFTVDSLTGVVTSAPLAEFTARHLGEPYPEDESQAAPSSVTGDQQDSDHF